MKVEIGQYKEVNKGMLKAFFSVVIYPQGEKVLDCRYFIKDDGTRWFSFPNKEVKFEGKKTEYIPLISYLNKEYLEELKESILIELKKKETNEEKNTSNQATKNTTQVTSPIDWNAPDF